MPRLYSKNESDEEEEEVRMDQGESGGESGDRDSSDNDSESGSDDDASSEMDEGESERRRNECLENMAHLENQFAQLKEQLYREKITLVSQKLEEVKLGTAKEFLSPLQKLKDSLNSKLLIADVRKELRKKNIENEVDAETQAARQNFESDKELLISSIEDDLNDKIRRLEEDRHNIDITSDLYNESQTTRRKRACVTTSTGQGGMGGSLERRRKPVTVQGPYVVLRLRESALIEDWSAIKLAIKQAEKLSADEAAQHSAVSSHSAPSHSIGRVFSKDGRLHYNNEMFHRGQRIIISHGDEIPKQADITNISSNEITITHRENHLISKLTLNQLRSGKYTLQRAAL